MIPTSVYPVICTDKVAETSDWYIRHFGFTVNFSADWYVSLQLGRFELAVLDYTHETIPEGFRRPAQGMLVNIEVDDVDAVHDEVVRSGVVPVLSLRSEDFGQRHFIVADPAGVLVDVITPIEPSGEFAQ